MQIPIGKQSPIPAFVTEFPASSWRRHSNLEFLLTMNDDQLNGGALHPDSPRNEQPAATADEEDQRRTNDLVSSTVDEYLDKFNKSELDQLLRSLKLSNEQCSILLSTLKEKNRLEESIDVHVYDNHQKELMQCFHVDGHTKRVKDVPGLFKWLNIDYSDPSEWILYIIYQQKYKALDCYLMDTSGQQAVMFLESQEVVDPFQVLKQAIEEADYKKYNWMIFGDFSAVSVARRSRQTNKIDHRIWFSSELFKRLLCSSDPPDPTRLTD